MKLSLEKNELEREREIFERLTQGMNPQSKNWAQKDMDHWRRVREQSEVKSQSLAEEKRSLVLEKSDFDKGRARSQEDWSNRMAAMEHAQLELDRNTEVLKRRETEFDDLRKQIQAEWAGLRKAEEQIHEARRVFTEEQQREKSRLLEWEARIRAQDNATSSSPASFQPYGSAQSSTFSSTGEPLGLKPGLLPKSLNSGVPQNKFSPTNAEERKYKGFFNSQSSSSKVTI